MDDLFLVFGLVLVLYVMFVHEVSHVVGGLITGCGVWGVLVGVSKYGPIAGVLPKCRANRMMLLAPLVFVPYLAIPLLIADMQIYWLAVLLNTGMSAGDIYSFKAGKPITTTVAGVGVFHREYGGLRDARGVKVRLGNAVVLVGVI